MGTGYRPLRKSGVSWLLAGVVLVALMGGLAARPWQAAAAELKGPQASDRQVTLAVASLLRKEHFSKRDLDDEISRRGLGNYLKALDPMKLYFTKADIEEFNQKRDDIDDMLKKGDISFAYTIFNRFLTRLDERVAIVDELLKEKPDFTVNETMVSNPEKAQWAEDAKAVRERWRKRIKYDLLVLKADKPPKEGAEAVDKLTRRYHSFAKRMAQTSSDEVLEMYLTSVTSSYDPHTSYMSPSTLDNFNIQMKLNLEGIGAALQLIDGYVVVSKVVPGGAADKDGRLKLEDRIVSVGEGEKGEMVDVVDMKLNDVVAKIRGKAGTVVRLGVIPAGGKETKIYNIVRQTIELKDSEARGVIFDVGMGTDGKPYKIGVIDLPSFYMDMAGARQGIANYKSTTRDVRKILNDFTAKGVDAVVLDLRKNGGGSLTEAINLTGLFIDEGPVVQVKDAEGKTQHYDDLDKGTAWSGPLVVLDSKFSASASEILAGAIQDYGRGLIIGDDTSHGKGTVQSLLDLGGHLFRIPNPPNYGALKITMQKFYRPSGDSTQKRGVLADITLPSITNHMDVAEADLDYALDFDKIAAVPFTKQVLVTPEIITALRGKSSERINKSTDFQKLQTNIKRYREQKDRKEVTLNEKAFFAERADLDADKEEEKQFDEKKPGDEIVKRDFYFNEVLDLTADYLEVLLRNKLVTKAPLVKPAG